MKKEKFYEKFGLEYSKWFKEWFIERKVDFSLKDLYGAYYDTYIEKIDQNIRLGDLINLKNRERFLIYLSKLLRSGDLKMKTFEREEDMSKRKENSRTYMQISSKEWEQEEVEQGIEYVREKWNSLEDSRERELGILVSDVYASREGVDVLINLK